MHFFLLQAQSDVQSRVEHIEVLEQELFQCNQEIEQLKEERQVKAEETVRAQTVGGYFKDYYNFWALFHPLSPPYCVQTAHNDHTFSLF